MYLYLIVKPSRTKEVASRVIYIERKSFAECCPETMGVSPIIYVRIYIRWKAISIMPFKIESKNISSQESSLQCRCFLLISYLCNKSSTKYVGEPLTCTSGGCSTHLLKFPRGQQYRLYDAERRYKNNMSCNVKLKSTHSLVAYVIICILCKSVYYHFSVYL